MIDRALLDRVRAIAADAVAATRSAAAVSALNLGIGVGAASGVLRRDKQAGRTIGVRLGSDLALAAAGVRLQVIGAQNLTRQLPAVFVVNHQSALDPLVIGSLIRSDFTTVGKREARFDPRVMVGAALLDVTFIDRSNSESARRDVNALVDRIAAGTSVAIFPEGTRTTTPLLNPFKKGAFHLAMDARVPMVPIVIRNAGELMSRQSSVIESGVVEVVVHEPISTLEWTLGNLDTHVGHVRHLMGDTLEHWPSG